MLAALDTAVLVHVDAVLNACAFVFLVGALAAI